MDDNRINLNELIKNNKYKLDISPHASPTLIQKIRDIVLIFFAFFIFGLFCWFCTIKLTDPSTTEPEQRWLQSSFFAIAGWIFGYITRKEFGQ